MVITNWQSLNVVAKQNVVRGSLITVNNKQCILEPNSLDIIVREQLPSLLKGNTFIDPDRLRNDLYCVEWDVKLQYTIPFIDPE